MVQGATRKKSARRAQQPLRRWLPLSWRRIGRLGIATCFALATLGLLVWGGWRLIIMPVNRVVVSGELQRVSREQLMAVVSESIEGGFLWTDLRTIREPIEQIPWVYRVVVRRQWPDSLEVNVIEQRVIARWGEGAFLNHAGEVFEPSSGQGLAADNLPLLAGPPGTEAELMQHYKLVQERLQAMGLQVSELAMDSRGGLTAQLQDAGRLVFGRGELSAKLGRFVAVYQFSLAQHAQEFSSVDLRYSHGVAVAWAEQQKT